MSRYRGALALVPAFRDKETGAVYVSPGYHDIRVIPGLEDVDDDDLDRICTFAMVEDGFVNVATDEFLTRAEAAELYGEGESDRLRRAGVKVE